MGTVTSIYFFMHKFIFLVACVLTFQSAASQELKVAYFGESFTHYGLKGGYSINLRSVDKQTKKGRSVSNALAFTPGLAIYRHAHNHVGLIVMPDVSYRRKNEKGRIFEAGISPGLFRSVLEGKVYEVNEAGELEKLTLAGRTAFMPTVFIGIGKDLSVKKGIELSWYTRLNVMKQIPYNASSLTRIAFEIGIVKPLIF
jgi:hypothetical protein